MNSSPCAGSGRRSAAVSTTGTPACPPSPRSWTTSSFSTEQAPSPSSPFPGSRPRRGRWGPKAYDTAPDLCGASRLQSDGIVPSRPLCLRLSSRASRARARTEPRLAPPIEHAPPSSTVHPRLLPSAPTLLRSGPSWRRALLVDPRRRPERFSTSASRARDRVTARLCARDPGAALLQEAINRRLHGRFPALVRSSPPSRGWDGIPLRAPRDASSRGRDLFSLLTHGAARAARARLPRHLSRDGRRPVRPSGGLLLFLNLSPRPPPDPEFLGPRFRGPAVESLA